MTRRRNRWQGRESRGDSLRALGLALLLHAGLFGLLYVGMLWAPTRPPPSVRGEVIEAVLVAAPASASRPRSTPRPAPPRAPPPQPKPVERPKQADAPPQPTPQQPPPKPDVTDQQRIQKLAQQQAEERDRSEQARREQEERRRQEQIDLTERQKQQEEAERQERLRQQELEREKQLADIRRMREEAQREREDAEKALKELENRRDSPKPVEPTRPDAPPQRVIGNHGVNDDLAGRYQLAIQQAVERNWIRPDTVRGGVACKLKITQAPGGTVVGVSVQTPCPYDELGRRSVEAAVKRAEPLPYRGFESVFNPVIVFTFKAPAD